MSDAKPNAARYGVIVSVLGVLGVEVWSSLQDGAPWLIWAMRLLPIIIFVPGMRADRLRSYIWLCFVCLLYFMVAVLRVFSPPLEFASVLGLVSVVSLFCSAMLYVRWRGQQLRKLREKEVVL